MDDDATAFAPVDRVGISGFQSTETSDHQRRFISDSSVTLAVQLARFTEHGLDLRAWV